MAETPKPSGDTQLILEALKQRDQKVEKLETELKELKDLVKAGKGSPKTPTTIKEAWGNMIHEVDNLANGTSAVPPAVLKQITDRYKPYVLTPGETLEEIERNKGQLERIDNPTVRSLLEFQLLQSQSILGTPPPTNTRQVTCYKCGRVGHYSNRCTYKRKLDNTPVEKDA